MKHFKYALSTAVALLPNMLNAQGLQVSSDTGSVGLFGGIGLLETRNGRFSNDGELLVGAGHIGDGQNYYVTWQATPWLETTLRYSDYNDNLDGIDKGLDLKLRLVKEGKYRPVIVIGLQDMLGDGVFSGEYIAASKKINDFDFTVGFGFGNLGNRAKVKNVARLFGGNFKNRSSTNDNSEKFRFGNYFSGEKMGFFWGLEYKTPIKGVTTKLEYSTVDKSTIPLFSDYESKTAFNFGVNYKVKNWLEVGAGLLHGNQFAFHLTLKQNLHRPMRLNFATGPQVDEIRSRQLNANAVNVNDYASSDSQDFIFERLRSMGFAVTSLNLVDDKLDVELESLSGETEDNIMVLGAVLGTYKSASINFIDDSENNIEAIRGSLVGDEAQTRYRNSPYFARGRNVAELTEANKQQISNSIISKMRSRNLRPAGVAVEQDELLIEKSVSPFDNIPKNIGRTVRILTNEAPDNVERFTVISKERGVNVSKVSILRKDFEKVADYNSSPEEIMASANIDNPTFDIGGSKVEKPLQDFDFGILPDVISHFGSDKNDHFKADLNLKLFARANISDSLRVYGEVKQHLIGNLDLIPSSTNLNVPHVRSDIGRYAAEGTTSITRLNVEYVKNPLKNVYTRITAGHLESMYSGVSGEVLYRPYDSSFSFGVDINFVKQRGFDQLFSYRDYETVTGHASLYYVNKKYDITSKVSAGRYLAKDWGTTIDVSRQFDNGIRIGATATFTDMSQSDFGRGSFDKGIYMIIPFDFFWYKQSREKMRFQFRRLGKNGGQKLDHNTNLFDLFASGQPYKLRNNWNGILE